MAQHTLKPGHYVICDPAYIIKKNPDGDRFNQQIIKRFFSDMNKFHDITIDGITFYMFRSLGGDGVFDGIGTDTGTFIIIETSQVMNDDRFKQDYSKGKIITFETDVPVTATFENFDLKLSNGISIHTE